MASTTAVTATTSTSATTSYASGAFTPAANDLLVVFVSAPGTVVTTPSLTDSQSLGFTLVQFTRKATSADSLYVFVANALAANSSMTVTFDCTGDAASGCIIQPYRISGMARVGLAAIRQTQTQLNQAATGTPAPAFAAACLTGNVTLGVVANASNPAGLTPPTSWTEDTDTGITGQGLEAVHRDSGFTGTTVTWGSTSATAFASIIIELDTASASGLYVDAISTSGSGATGAVSSITTTHVVGSGSNMALFAVVGIIDNSAGRNLLTGITYNGTAMQFLGRIADRGGSELFNNLYVLVNPSAGSHTLQANFSANLNVSSSIAGLVGISCAGVHQTYPYKLLQTQVSGEVNSVTLTETISDASSTDGDLLIGVAMSHQPGLTTDGAQQIVVDWTGMNNGGAQGWGVSVKRAAIGASFTWTQSLTDVWSSLGIGVRAATVTPSIPVLYDTATSMTTTGAGPATLSFTSSGPTNGLLLVCVAYTTVSTRNVTAMTWNSQSLTKLTEKRTTDGAQVNVSEMWYLKGPSAATSNISATFSASHNSFAMAAMTLALVDQSSTFGTAVTKSSTSGGSTYDTGAITSSTAALCVATYWLWSDTNGYIVPDHSETVYTTVGTGGTGVSLQAQAAIGAASVTIGGTVGASGGGLDYNAIGVGINYGAAAGETITLDKWFRQPVDVARRRRGVVPMGIIGIKSDT